MISYSLPIFYGFYLTLTIIVLLLNRKIGCRYRAVISFIICVLAVSIFYGLRHATVGVDTQEYISRFNHEIIRDDFLFSSIGILLKNLGASAQFYLFFLAFLTSSFLYLAIKNFSKGDSRKASLFFILATFMPYGVMSYINVARQGLAVAIILFGISLPYRYKFKKSILALIGFLCHKATGAIYILAKVINYCIRNHNARLIALLIFIVFTITVTLYPDWITHVLEASAISSRLESYQSRITSESEYLIYIKIAWAIMHFGILLQINKGTAIPRQLLVYYFTVVATSVLFSANQLTSSRVLSVIDISLPALYAYPVQGPRVALFRKIGVLMAIIYAAVSPLVFQMYKINFGW